MTALSHLADVTDLLKARDAGAELLGCGPNYHYIVVLLNANVRISIEINVVVNKIDHKIETQNDFSLRMKQPQTLVLTMCPSGMRTPVWW